MNNYKITINGFPATTPSIARAAAALVGEVEEHGALGGNTFDAGWLESEHGLKRRDAYALGAQVGGDRPHTISWVDCDGLLATVNVAYERGSFTVSFLGRSKMFRHIESGS